MSETSTEDLIRPIITSTYGDNGMSRALVVYLAEQIDKWPDTTPSYGADKRERMILHTCWNWFSGGSTAEAVAKEIEAALS